MTRPVSDLDLEFLEGVAGIAYGGEQLCKLLAVCHDPEGQLAILADIKKEFKTIRAMVIRHKPHVAQQRRQRLTQN